MHNSLYVKGQEDTYKKTSSVFGQKLQIIKAIEELAELQQAISKFLIEQEHKVFVNIDNVYEEIADVQIMIEQLILIFDCHDIIKTVKKQKIERLKGLVENG